MDTMIKFNGVIGILILFVSMAILLLIIIITFIIFNSEIRSSKIKSEPRWARYLLMSAIIFLLFDGAFLLMLLRNPTFNASEAADFDDRMIFIWIPCHIVGCLFSAYMLRFIQLHKVKINKFIDKLR